MIKEDDPLKIEHNNERVLQMDDIPERLFYQLVQPTHQEPPRSIERRLNAERQRRYRERRKAKKAEIATNDVPKRRPLTPAERQRRSRERRKAEKMNADFSQYSNDDIQPQQEQGDVLKNKPLTNAERQRRYRELLREKEMLDPTLRKNRMINVDPAARERKRLLSKERQSRFRARQRVEYASLSTTPSHPEQSESSSSGSDGMNLDTLELINEIMIRPEIWMSKHPANKNKWKTLRKWEEMKNTKFPLFTVDDLKKRWKNIKDQYRKELKKLPAGADGAGPSWKYFEYMSFLKDELGLGVAAPSDTLPDSGSQGDFAMEEIIIKTEVPDSPHSEEKSEDEEPQASAPQRPRYCQPPRGLREELLKIEQRKLQILEAEVAKQAEFSKSDNYQFLMSILPEMEKLPAISKMRLRTKISQAVLDEVTASEELQPRFPGAEGELNLPVKEEPINMYD